ncbi:hypothetical protein [Gordonia sp. (in: high G+C Gram-positive bacteria)]|uniref:hypothetical protein n=1 Tax=Gordonia sp. (in: high G+C Gram-positive bacteria) TaxID=84139 RepID=UPI00333F11A6
MTLPTTSADSVTAYTHEAMLQLREELARMNGTTGTATLVWRRHARHAIPAPYQPPHVDAHGTPYVRGRHRAQDADINTVTVESLRLLD